MIAAVTIFLLLLAKPLVSPLPKRAILVSMVILIGLHYLQLKLAANFAGLHPPLLEPLLLAFLLVLLAGSVVALRRSTSDMSLTTAVANIFSSVLFFTTVFSSLNSTPVDGAVRWGPVVDQITQQGLSQPLQPAIAQPDIYYIILDGYARADTLVRLYDFDNSEFIGFLRERGFYIADRTRSNYSQTYLSLASSLNFTYLDGLSDALGDHSRDRTPLDELINGSSVVQLLRGIGYQFWLLPSDYEATDAISLADRHFCEEPGPTDIENFIISTSILNTVPAIHAWQHRRHADHILCTLQYLAELPQANGPRLIFAHLVAPHPPFVFGSTGEPRLPSAIFNFNDGDSFAGSQQEYALGYRDQLRFVNTRIQDVINAILAKPGLRPVIILQADHGPGQRLIWDSYERTDTAERMGIFSAYLVPDEVKEMLYDRISPVNTFRVLFNGLFGTRLELLEDKSYFSTWDAPYRFIELPPETTTQ